MRKIIVIGLLFLFNSNISLEGQVALSTNQAKYWHYRARLINHFLVIGPNQGESLPAGIRNQTNSSIADWGDGPVYLGYYIGVLATEYRLLLQNNKNTDQTLTKLYYAINAIKG
jgi:hypothetical protein